MANPCMVTIIPPEPCGESQDAGVSAGTTKTAQPHGVQCEFPACAACCPVRMLTLSKNAKLEGSEVHGHEPSSQGSWRKISCPLVEH